MSIVAVANLKKSYGDFQAVKGISFSIEPGEVFGFLGPNGAGKTSAINMLVGLSRPTEGSINICGIDIVKDTEKAQALMGIVPDESNLYDEMSGFDNLCFCAALYGMKKVEREKRAKNLLMQFDLDKAGGRPFRAYSKGMKRKLTIAAGIIHSPEILFLDEPTTGIDVESARHIRELLLALKENGSTIFITTHYIEDAERICDRIAFIVGGNIVDTGSMKELMEHASQGHSLRLTGDPQVINYVELLRQHIAGCEVSVSSSNTVTITSVNRIPLSPIIRVLEENNISIYEARELLPSLEDVFVKVTGIDSVKLKKEKEGGKKI